MRIPNLILPFLSSNWLIKNLKAKKQGRNEVYFFIADPVSLPKFLIPGSKRYENFDPLSRKILLIQNAWSLIQWKTPLIPIPGVVIPDPGAVIPDLTLFLTLDAWSHIPRYDPEKSFLRNASFTYIKLAWNRAMSPSKVWLWLKRLKDTKSDMSGKNGQISLPWLILPPKIHFRVQML